MNLNHDATRASFIWNIADALRGAYRPHDYGKVILPMTVLRRFDCVIEPTRQAVWDKLEEYQGVASIEHLLYHAAGGVRLYNTSPFDLTRLLDDPENVADNLREYVAGFSPNAREILDRFDFNTQIAKLDEKGRLRSIVAKFAAVDLHPEHVPNAVMGHIFEDLIARFYELANEEAGDYFTPREVIRLMVNLLFAGDGEVLTTSGIIKTLYDPACGTGGMLSVSEDYFGELNPDGRLEVFGQDYNDESYAICRADMLLKGQDESHIHPDNSLTRDGERGRRFDYMISNPPYGVDWKEFAEEIESEHRSLGWSGRFGAGLPPKDDGALLFLQHMAGKMKPPDEGGSRIAIIMSGSPLFAGAPGSGMGAIRAWLLEQDLVEAIVALPEQLFYNTGIATYIWLVTNRKAAERAGVVQLIDARELWEKMPKSLGEKRRRLGDEHINEVCLLHGDRVENDRSKILPIEAFSFRRITIERPLRLRYDVGPESAAQLAEQSAFKNLVKPPRASKKPDEYIAKGKLMQQGLVAALDAMVGYSTADGEAFDLKLRETVAEHTPQKVSSTAIKAVRKVCAVRDESAPPARDPRGRALPDSNLRDFENVPPDEDPKDYFEREVRPWVHDAWIDESRTLLGYEIPVTRHFYRYEPPRPLDAIDEDIKTAEEEILTLLRAVTT